ncbi:MAG: sensor histidine kinase [Rhodocyclales bacterium GT-UBC]|nr:MAG: sensor histidine kinase [Rhodocyclales bacterium GT-UBC]
MPFISCSTASADHLATLRRLVHSRWPVLASMFLLVLFVPGWLDIPLSIAPMLAILCVALGINLGVQWRIQNATTASANELFSQLLIDIFTLSGLVFFSGGATNPLISLLLPSVAIAALTLPITCVMGIGMAAISAYSLLMVYYIPLPLPDASRATRLHLVGMWLTFVVSATMIGWFVVRMTQLIRQRDAELAAAREQALRDERVMAMGTLAAGAAHELGTPLATMALVAGELAHDFASNAALPQSARDDIELLRQQIGVCKHIITGLSRRAGAERLEKSPMTPVDQWLDALRQHWHATRPHASSRVACANRNPPPEILADPRLEQAVLNLLNNAANASPHTPLALDLDWSATHWQLSIRDFGPGIPQEVLNHFGHTAFTPHEKGSGIGLMLTRSAIEQLGGQLYLSNVEEGGALARIELPLPRT